MKNDLGFKLPHLSLKIFKRIKAIADPIFSKRTIRKEKDLYLQKPGGENEFNREISEKYVTGFPKYKLKNIPTDDGEVQDEEFKSKLKPHQLGATYRTDL